ncbi:hypothetical protein CK203_075853 [Vitis vinifera]|uniref:Uncharacterized protein n=1 Tax=Vitis vinifera TaxID=29760 RepID=A0A438EF74_VITVI|nr:hypothetical protein CK203_075853 [Vitis vinifera]
MWLVKNLLDDLLGFFRCNFLSFKSIDFSLFKNLQMTVYARGVSVLMPGEDIPTFIAHPAPVPCPPDRIPWPLKEHNSTANPSSNPNNIADTVNQAST